MFIWVLLLSINVGVSIEYDAKFPFQDPTLPWDRRVDDLVGRLTLDEIVPQTLAVYGSYTPAIPRLGIKPYVWITECVHGQVSTNTTGFPHSIGLAAAFSKELMFNVSEAISYEVRAHWNGLSAQGQYQTMNGLSCFSPVVNIMRHPLWGRNQETYGEDPYLSGQYATMFVKGVQGDNPRYVRVNAGCKHFDVHGGPENIPVSRFSFDAKVSMRDWRMTFLPQFKACVEAGTYSLMCSYNSINGVPACANTQLLTDITRKEWGFKGYIVSDAGAVSNIMTQHHYLNNSVDTAAASIKSGCNLELGSEVFKSQLDAMKAGKLTEAQIRDNVKPLMYTRLRLGEWDPPSMNPYSSIGMSVVQSEAHRMLAKKAAMMSFVLLKNSNSFLPMKTQASLVAVIGPMANNSAQQFGDYGSNVLPEFTTTPLDTLQHLGQKYAYASGCDNNNCLNYDSQSIKTAVAGTDLIVACLGTGQAVESEGHDRADLNLPGHQLDLLKDAADNSQAKIILLLFNAGPLDISWALNSDRVAAIMACFFPAQSTGEALLSVLALQGGQVEVPAGRLQATWPTTLDQIPPITDYTMEGRTYRYYKFTPLLPFGYGLSYSSFTYSDLMVSPSQVTAGSSVTVTATVTNNGPFEADEVTQVYIAWTNSTLPHPNLQLVGFGRQRLAINMPQKVSFTITGEQMHLWDDTKGFVILPGMMEVYVGGQQPGQHMDVGSNVLKGSFTITET